MLITISGMVGSGKSTTARTIVERLSAAGLEPRSIRFRFLPLFGFANPSRRDVPVEASQSSQQPVRGRQFRSGPLSVARTVGYAARMLSFRLAGVGRWGRCDVLDRYFYDNLVQYDLRSTRERVYLGLLRRLMPRPDLAILLVASETTIARRRPNYAPEYLGVVCPRYRQLSDLFPELTTISTDDGIGEQAVLEEAIQRLIRLESARG